MYQPLNVNNLDSLVDENGGYPSQLSILPFVEADWSKSTRVPWLVS